MRVAARKEGRLARPLSDFFGSIMNALGASIRVFKLLDGRPSIRTSGGTALPSVDGLIELRAVSFAYPARADVRVLREVDMTITPGSVVALCGPSGAGKSTVVGMIQRWYDPTSGSIHVDGTPLSQLDPSWWRRQMALVAQEPVLFACSILDNVAYGVAGADAADAATRAAVEQACATANAIDFVRAFPDGLDTGVLDLTFDDDSFVSALSCLPHPGHDDGAVPVVTIEWREVPQAETRERHPPPLVQGLRRRRVRHLPLVLSGRPRRRGM